MYAQIELDLWSWLEDCEARKPRENGTTPDSRDQVVRVLQDGSVRGREASEDGAPSVAGTSKLQ